MQLTSTALLVVQLGALLSSAQPNYTVVFQHGEGGYPCIRIPSISRCGSTLHAFAECRTSIGDGCIPTARISAAAKGGVASGLVRSVCYKNSTDDGATWSPLLPLAADAFQPTVVCDSYKATVLLQFNANNSNWQISSRDDGGHWSEPQAIDLGHYNGTYVGPGVGLQLSEDSHTPGRLLFIGHYGSYEYDIVWYSDDHGDTYQLGKTTLLHMDEAQLVELDNGVVMANMRNDHLNPCDCRAVSLSSDGGETFGNITFNPTLISPVCMATILRTGNGSLLFANPASKTSRVNGLVRRSDDDGATWPYSYLVTTGDYAYSCLTQVSSDSEVGLLWETSADGCIGVSCLIVFSKIKWV